MTFTKTNFSGYSIQLRGIGTQAISVTTDPAVAVAFNDIPFIRNHFFEQEFYDVSQVEVLRGPQGTLYGRNATAGVVNLVSAKPTDQFEAMASADIGNYQNRRLEGMINIPIVDDRLDIRVAGEWTKRQGYSFNEADRSTASTAAICGRAACRSAGSRSQICRPISSGSISPKTTTACAPPSSFAKPRPRPRRSAVYRFRQRVSGRRLNRRSTRSGDYLRPGLRADLALFAGCVRSAERIYAALCFGDRKVRRGFITPGRSILMPAPTQSQKSAGDRIRRSIRPTKRRTTVELNADYAVTPR